MYKIWHTTFIKHNKKSMKINRNSRYIEKYLTLDLPVLEHQFHGIQDFFQGLSEGFSVGDA